MNLDDWLAALVGEQDRDDIFGYCSRCEGPITVQTYYYHDGHVHVCVVCFNREETTT